MKGKMLALVLAVVLVLPMLPTTGQAEASTGVTVNISGHIAGNLGSEIDGYMSANGIASYSDITGLVVTGGAITSGFTTGDTNDLRARVKDSLQTVDFSGASFDSNHVFTYSLNSLPALRSVVLPDTVTHIESWAFWNCAALETVYLPTDLVDVGDAAFYQCPSLQNLHTSSATPPSVVYGAFTGVAGDAAIHVPADSEAAWDQGDPGTSLDNNCKWYGIFIENMAPVIECLPERFSQRTGIISVYSNEPGVCYYALTRDGEAAPTVDTAGEGEAFEHTSPSSHLPYKATIVLTPLDPEAYDVYVKAKDSWGNVSELVKIDLEAYIPPVDIIVNNHQTGNLYDEVLAALEAAGVPNRAEKVRSLKLTGGSLNEDDWSIVSFLGTAMLSVDLSGTSSQSIPGHIFSMFGIMTDISLPIGLQSIGASSFAGCADLADITLPSPVPPTVGDNAFDGVPAGATVRVPYGSAAAYRAVNDGNTADTLWYGLTIVEPVPPTHTITVQNDGQGAGSANPTAAAQGQRITLTATPKSGYHFKVWQVISPASLSISGNAFTMPNGAVTVKALFAVNTYTVTFNSQGGSSVTGQTIAHNGLVTKPANPSRTGYTFGGWYRQAACTAAWNFTTDKVTANTTIYAKWTINKYTVSATANSTSYGTVTGGGSFTYGTSVTLKAVPKAGHRFVRWLEGKAIVSTSVEYKFTVIHARTLKAEFTIIGTPSSPKAASAGYNSVKVNWNTVTGAKEYEIYRATSSKGPFTKIGATTTTSYTNTGLTTGTTYYFRVRAKCVAGSTITYGGYSTVVLARPIPATPVVKAASAGYNSIKLTWAAISGTTKYEVYRATSSAGPYARIAETSAIGCTNGSLTTGVAYYYKVRAYRTVGSTRVYSGYSSIASAKPVPATPSVSAARASSSSIQLIWGKVAGAMKYEIYRATSKTGTYVKLAETTSTGYTNTKLTTGRTYYYKVRACRTVSGKNIYGSFSTVVSAKP